MLKRYLPLAGVALFGFAACSPDSTDFKDEGEKYIESDDISEQTGIEFSDADCEEPANTDEGTEYTCSASGNDGGNYVFTIEITGERELTVVDFQAA